MNIEEEIYMAPEEKSFKSDINLVICDEEDGYSDYGEAFVGQRLLLDFKFDENIDDEEVQAKCCEFWDFVNNQSELMVHASSESLSDKCYMESANHSVSSKSTVKEKTAVSMLNLVQQKGLINCAFEAKLPTKSCKEVSNDYMLKSSITDTVKNRFKISNVNKKSKQKSQSSAPGTLFQKLHIWDLEHPKSLHPPGPVPTISEENVIV